MTPLEAMMAGILALNSLGVFVVLFKSGIMVGQNDQRWKDLYNRLNNLEEVMKSTNDTKVTLATLQEAVQTIQRLDSVRHYQETHQRPHD